MSLGALEPKFWKNFCETVKREDLIGGQFGGPEVVSEVERIFESRTKEEWLATMAEADACCEPVLSLKETVISPLVQARNMVTQTADGKRFLGSPLKMSGSPSLEDAPAPALGKHTREVLSQLGLTEQQMETLAGNGII